MTATFRKALFLVLLALACGVAHADPLTSCVLNTTAGGGITCNVYQVKSDFTHSQISDAFELPTFVTSGYLVITQDVANESDMSKWIDVVSFIDNGAGRNSSIQLFSIGCNGLNPSYSCFPNYLTVTSAATHAFMYSTGSLTFSPKVYVASFNIYYIYDFPVETPLLPPSGGGTGELQLPEPASLLLLGSGLLVIAGRFARKAKHHC